MLDIELMSFVESLPISYRVRMGKAKIVHKAMAERYLPNSIVHRPKKGFYVPFSDWARGQWKDRVHSMFFSEGPHHRWLDQKALLNLWNAHQDGQEHSPRRLFALLMFVSWTQWLEKKPEHT
jgi:asparagine synthase (glutamine-hydrolysing)